MYTNSFPKNKSTKKNWKGDVGAHRQMHFRKQKKILINYTVGIHITNFILKYLKS